MKHPLLSSLFATFLAGVSAFVYYDNDNIKAFNEEKAQVVELSIKQKKEEKRKENEKFSLDEELGIAINNEYKQFHPSNYTSSLVDFNGNEIFRLEIRPDGARNNFNIVEEFEDKLKLRDDEDVMKDFSRYMAENSTRIIDPKVGSEPLYLEEYLCEMDKTKQEFVNDMSGKEAGEYQITYNIISYTTEFEPMEMPSIDESFYTLDFRPLLPDQLSNYTEVISTTAQEQYDRAIKDYITEEISEAQELDPRALEVKVQIRNEEQSSLKDYINHHDTTWEKFFEGDDFYPRTVYKVYPVPGTQDKPYFLIHVHEEGEVLRGNKSSIERYVKVYSKDDYDSEKE